MDPPKTPDASMPTSLKQESAISQQGYRINPRWGRDRSIEVYPLAANKWMEVAGIEPASSTVLKHPSTGLA